MLIKDRFLININKHFLSNLCNLNSYLHDYLVEYITLTSKQTFLICLFSVDYISQLTLGTLMCYQFYNATAKVALWTLDWTTCMVPGCLWKNGLFRSQYFYFATILWSSIDTSLHFFIPKQLRLFEGGTYFLSKQISYRRTSFWLDSVLTVCKWLC